MVAAWMSAETGVGPAMASGSHTYSGICALLPVAPTNSSRPMAIRVPVVAVATVGRTSVNSREPKVAKMMNIATMKPTSPMRLVTNAFLAAAAYAGFSNQKPISR